MHSQTVEDHLTWCRARGLARPTIALRRRLLSRVERDLGPVTGVTSTGLVEWLAGLEVTPASRRTYLVALRAFWRWAVTADALVDVTASVEMPRAPRRTPRPLDPIAVELAVRLAPEPIATWILLGWQAGLRCVEIAGLRGEDVRSGWLLVTGKGGHQRMIPVTATVTQQLADLPSSGRLWDVTAGEVSRRGNRWLRRLGAGGTMHQLRHTYATQLYDERGDLLVVQTLLGHQSSATTQIYAQVSDRRLIEAVTATFGSQ